MKRSFLCLAHALAIILLAALIVGAVPGSSRLRRGINDYVESVLYRSNGTRPGDSRIVLAAIDDESISRIGEFPWRRSVAARLIDRLTLLGARTIVYDVMFVDPAPDPADDRALAEAIRKSGRVICAGYLGMGKDGRGENHQDPLPLIAQASAGVGNVSTTDHIEPDGTIRSLPSRMSSAGHPDTFPLALAAVAHYLQRDPREVAAALPALVRLNYRGLGSVQILSVSHILDDQLSPAETSALRDAIVFVGSVSPKAFDLHPSPLGGQMPGPLVHLTFADNILNHRWFASLRPAADFIACTLPVALLLAWCATLSNVGYLTGVAGAALACILASWLTFASGLWLRPANLLTAFLAACIWTIAARKMPPRNG